MTITISILGLDQIGTSLGLALREFKEEFMCKGYDPDPSKQNHQILKQAFDSVDRNPVPCVNDAQVIFLSLPADSVEQILTEIKDKVRAETVIICLSPPKVAVEKFVNEILGSSVHYVAMHFLLSPREQLEMNSRVDHPSSKLFENNLAAIAIPANTETAVLDLVTGLCSRLGAVPYFCDLLEMDGLISKSSILPQLVSSAFLNATMKSPGWQEAGKFAGIEYELTCSAIAANEDSLGLSQAAIFMKEHLLRGLESMINSLDELKQSISSNNPQQLEKLLEQARLGRIKWWSDRINKPPSPFEQANQLMPSKGDFWKQQIGTLGRKSKRNPKGSGQ